MIDAVDKALIDRLQAGLPMTETPFAVIAAELVALAGPRAMELVAVSEDAREIPGVEPAGLDGVELVVSIGGDGTVLEAVQQTLSAQIPVLGINLGRVGFLAEVERTHLAEAVERIAARRFIVEDRMTLKAVIDDGPVVHGLNDVVISKRVSQRRTVHVGWEWRIARSSAVSPVSGVGRRSCWRTTLRSRPLTRPPAPGRTMRFASSTASFKAACGGVSCNHPRARQCLMLPGLGGLHLVALEIAERTCHRAEIARWP